MSPEEIVNDLNVQNRTLLSERNDGEGLTKEQLLALMNVAAMEGFKRGSNLALSMVQGALCIQRVRGLPSSRIMEGEG